MNETQIYSVIMFFTGVALTHAVFYFDRKQKEKNFYILMSACILQVLDSVHSIHMASIEFMKQQTKTAEEIPRDEYLLREGQKVSVFMDLYVLLLIKAVPQKGQKYINYKSWPEAKVLIEKLRGFVKDEQDKR